MSNDNSREEQKSPHPLPVISGAQQEMSSITAQNESESLCIQNLMGDNIPPQHSNKSSISGEASLQKIEYSIDLNRVENHSNREKIRSKKVVQSTSTQFAKLKDRTKVNQPQLQPIPSASITNINQQIFHHRKDMRKASVLNDENKKAKCSCCSCIIVVVWTIGSCMAGGVITYAKTENLTTTAIVTAISFIAGILIGMLTNYIIAKCRKRNEEVIDERLSVKNQCSK
jgi:hypothetical protein